MQSYKVLLVGNAKRGKSEWTSLARGTVPSGHYSATLGVAVYNVALNSNKSVNLWDTAGKEKYRGLVDGYYMGADVALVFANNELEAQKWIQEIQNFVNNDRILVLSPTDYIPVFTNTQVINMDLVSPHEILDIACH